MSMQAEKIIVGPLETNCYLLYDEVCSVLIDPGDDYRKISGKIRGTGRPLAAILLTHGHFDHIGAVARLKAETGAKVYIHEADASMITDPQKSLAFMTGAVPEAFEPDVFVNDGDVLTFGGMSLKVMHTPGHSAGSVCYSTGAVIFDGDLIFKCSIGRYDYGSYTDEINSVKRVLSAFPGETLIYPGHGSHTSVEYERKFNPYVRNEVRP